MRFVRPRDLTLMLLTEGGLLLRVSSRGIACKAPTFAAELLGFCNAPRSAIEVEGRYGPQGRKLFDDLIAAGLLLNPTEAESTPAFFDNFSALDVHRRMLMDQRRLDAYAAAIEQVVQPGMAVLDAGTGTGVLAALAAQRGTRIVYGVDNSDVLDMAKVIITESGLDSRISLIRGDFRTAVLPEAVDVIVTETFGAWGLAEDGVGDIQLCCARNLAPHGQIIPAAIQLCIGLVRSESLYQTAVGAFRPWHGIQLDALRHSAMHRGIPVDATPDDLAAPGVTFSRIPLGEAAIAIGTVTFERVKPGKIHGFLGWFALELTPEIRLDTGPHAPSTHWRPIFMPMEPWVCNEQPIHVEVRLGAAQGDRRGLEANIHWKQGENEGKSEYRIR